MDFNKMLDAKQLNQWAKKPSASDTQTNTSKCNTPVNDDANVDREHRIAFYATRMAKVAYQNIVNRLPPGQPLEGTPVPHIILPAQAVLHLLTVNDPGVFTPDGNKFSDAEMYLFATHFIPELTMLIGDYNAHLSNKKS